MAAGVVVRDTVTLLNDNMLVVLDLVAFVSVENLLTL
jgi:hypothetical protein